MPNDMNDVQSIKSVESVGISLYIHIPFCKTKCPYCDFNTYQGIENLMMPFLDSLNLEIALWGRALGNPRVNTIFFGGGTPSFLPQGQIGRILTTAAEAFRVEPGAEITVEANPGDLSQQSCCHLLGQGVNRLSIGTQAFNNDLLTLLGRRHNVDEAISAFTTARAAGFSNVNLDFMYGIPKQSMDHWSETMSLLTSLDPDHVSLYCLTLEDGTPLQKWVQEGKFPEPDPDLAADMYHLAETELADAGYHHYEISNWSKPGLPSVHNMAYWLNRPYLGVGPGAHSSLNRYRFWDIDSPRTYGDRVHQWEQMPCQGPVPLTAEALDAIPQVGGFERVDASTACAETMFLGLRLLDGLDLEEASDQVGVDLAAHFKPQIQESLDAGLLEQEGATLRLTKPAYLVANQVFTKFVG